mgnify:CR=1 FL=1
MTTCNRGEVVLIGFVFSDESGKKLRPALVVSTPAYHRSRRDVIVVAITSNTQRRLVGDHPIDNWKGAGLLMPSVATGILRTIKAAMIERRLGVIGDADLKSVEHKLRHCMAL